MLCYMARPIDLTRLTEEQNKHYLFVSNALQNRGVVRYEPARAFSVPARAVPDGTIEGINRRALHEAHAMVAFYPESKTIGVPMEIEFARGRQMPLLVVADPDAARHSWALAGLHGTVRVTSYPTADDIDWLVSEAEKYGWEVQGKIGTPMRVQLDDGAQMPTRGYQGDAGFDLYVQEDVTVPPGEFVDVACGCAVQLPDHLWAMITGRSSTLRKHKLMVAQGVIDSGYRGPLFAGVFNLADEPFEVKKGMRLAQLIPFGNVAENLRLIEATTLDPSARGTAGFGSSGE
jgi:dUTP pyrophosphatase